MITATERFTGEVAAGDGSTPAREGAEREPGAPAEWDGRSAGEPARFTGASWNERRHLDPQWSINTEGLPAGAQPGDRIVGDVCYRDGADGLRVVDVGWSTLESVG